MSGRCICCERAVGPSNPGVCSIIPAGSRVAITWCHECRPTIQAEFDRLIQRLQSARKSRPAPRLRRRPAQLSLKV